MNTKNIIMSGVGYIFRPGIYKIECTTVNRALFGDDIVGEAGIQKILKDLRDGTCENKRMLEDYETDGLDSFNCEIIISGDRFHNYKLRLAALEEAKKFLFILITKARVFLSVYK